MQDALRCETTAGGALDLSFRRLAGVAGLGYALERSLDLANWTAVPPGDRTEAIVDCGCALEEVVWQVQPPVGQPRAFYRLRLTATP